MLGAIRWETTGVQKKINRKFREEEEEDDEEEQCSGRLWLGFCGVSIKVVDKLSDISTTAMMVSSTLLRYLPAKLRRRQGRRQTSRQLAIKKHKRPVANILKIVEKSTKSILMV